MITQFRSAFALISIIAVLVAVLAFSIGPTSVAAQTSPLFPDGFPAANISSPNSPTAPFGYGGGPAAPQITNGASILEIIFERLSAIFGRMFGR